MVKNLIFNILIMLKPNKIKKEDLSLEEIKLIEAFEKQYKKRKAIWKGQFTFRYIGWRDAPICDKCGKKMEFIYTRNDCCATRRSTLNWGCKTCSCGATLLPD